MQEYLRHLQVKFVCQGHQVKVKVKVKVTGAKNMSVYPVCGRSAFD